MKCFYPPGLNGVCCAAIVDRKSPGGKFLPSFYGREFEWDNMILDEPMFIVGFTPSPGKDLVRISEISKPNLTWIDCTRYAVDTEAEFNLEHIIGVRSLTGSRDLADEYHNISTTDLNSCELIWDFIIGGPIPTIVKYIAQIEIADYSDPDAVKFCAGLKSRNITPPSAIWNGLFNGDSVLISDIINDGAILLEQEENLDLGEVTAYSYPYILENRMARIINKEIISPTFFDNIERYVGKHKTYEYDFLIWYWQVYPYYEARIIVKEQIIFQRIVKLFLEKQPIYINNRYTGKFITDNITPMNFREIGV